MKKAKILKKIENKNNKNTFDAIVDVVSYTENIQYYSYEREDYKELALNAITNNSSAIKYVSPLCKDYAFLCEEAIKDDPWNFLLIDESVESYKELGIKAIMKNKYIVSSLPKACKHYYFFWKVAVFNCFIVLREIEEEQNELFSLIAIAIDKNPKAIAFVKSDLSIYNNLCRFAYSKDKESIDYMSINNVDDKLALEMIKRHPERIREIRDNKSYYKEACKIAVNLNSELFEHIDISNLKTDLDFVFELMDIAKKDNPEIMESYNAIYALYLKYEQNESLFLKQNISVAQYLASQFNLGYLDSQIDQILTDKLCAAAEKKIKDSITMHGYNPCSDHECLIRSKN